MKEEMNVMNLSTLANLDISIKDILEIFAKNQWLKDTCVWHT